MILTLEQMRKSAPAIFTERALGSLSERYEAVNTLDAIKALGKEGWLPVSAEQKRSRPSDLGGASMAKHLVRFRHETARGIFKGGRAAVGQAFPEIVLANAHNGTSAYRLLAGMFVVACSNGLMVAEKTLGSITVRHLKGNADELLGAAEKISKQIKPVVGRVSEMREFKLNAEQRNRFAEEALAMKFPGDNAPFKAADLLVPRRESDAREDLWAVFNVVQENLMAGGLKGRTTSGRAFTSLPVRDINRKLNYNQALWEMAEHALASRN